MPISYGILRGRASRLLHHSTDDPSPHVEVQVQTPHGPWQLAINVRSDDRTDLLFHIDTDFRHPILEALLTLPSGLTQPARNDHIRRMDYVRGDLFDSSVMRAVSAKAVGEPNELDDKSARSCTARCRPMALRCSPAATFGDRAQAGPDLHFLLGRGVNDLHMNQGSPSPHDRDDGVWQDGGLIVRLPRAPLWILLCVPEPVLEHGRRDRQAPQGSLIASVRSISIPAQSARSPRQPPAARRDAHAALHEGIAQAMAAAVTPLERAPHRGMITACIICATLLQSLDQTIANVALPYMQGSFSASYDEITWVLTTYITAAAIMTAPVGWLAARFGRKRLFVSLHHRLHHHLDAVRRGADAGADRAVPPAAGHVQRRPGAAVAGRSCSTSIRPSGAASRWRCGAWA